MIKKLLFIFLIVLLSITLIRAFQDKKFSVPTPIDYLIDLEGQRWKFVEVCSVSGLLPTEYCPIVVKRFFKYPNGLPGGFCETHTPKLTYPVNRLQAEFNRPIYLTTWLLPSMLIYENATFEKYREFIDEFVAGDYGNTLRFFSAGVWESETIKLIRFPFIKVNKKFDLEQMNPVWLEESLRRIRYFINCGGTVVYTLIDGCSMHGFSGGWWNCHWWNGNRNVNGTNPDVKAIRHMYSWSDKETLKTKYYVLKFLFEMVGILEKEFPNSIIYDFNEFWGTAEWYLNVDRDVFQKFNIPKHRKMFSIVNPDYGDVATIMSQYIWQPHGICSLEAYSSIYHPALGLIQPSADGCVPPPDREQTKWIVFNALIDNKVGFENNWRWNPEWEENAENYWKQTDWEIARGMKEGFLMWYEVNNEKSTLYFINDSILGTHLNGEYGTTQFKSRFDPGI